MSRSTHAIIDLEALLANFILLKSLAPSSEPVAVIKADAYGNGAVRVAKKLSPYVKMFAVAFKEEALELRDAGILAPILILQGPSNESECVLTDSLNLTWMLHREEQLEWMSSAIFQNKVQSVSHWVKFDTGMHRLGFMPEEINSLEERYPAVFNKSTVIATHFSAADKRNSQSAKHQLCLFNSLLHNRQYAGSIANSAGHLGIKFSHRDWNRLGIVLFGCNPVEALPADLKVCNVMSLYAPIISIRTIDKGESVGYGDTWVAQRESMIATVAIGYADGYPRHAPSGTPAVFGDSIAPLAGRVSMDMITFDVTDIPNIKIGDMVELWGSQLSIEDVARHIGTISYELMTRLSSRVPRNYIGE